MSSLRNIYNLHVVGVALTGRDGFPVVVFQDTERENFLSLPTDPFEAEFIIREFIGEGEDSAVSWLAEIIGGKSLRQAVLEIGADNRPAVRFFFGGLKTPSERVLPLGEGLGLCRRLRLRLSAESDIFELFRDELAFLCKGNAFRENFLYLTPPLYAPTIAVE